MHGLKLGQTDHLVESVPIDYPTQGSLSWTDHPRWLVRGTGVVAANSFDRRGNFYLFAAHLNLSFFLPSTSIRRECGIVCPVQHLAVDGDAEQHLGPDDRFLAGGERPLAGGGRLIVGDEHALGVVELRLNTRYGFLLVLRGGSDPLAGSCPLPKPLNKPN